MRGWAEKDYSTTEKRRSTEKIPHKWLALAALTVTLNGCGGAPSPAATATPSAVPATRTATADPIEERLRGTWDAVVATTRAQTAQAPTPTATLEPRPLRLIAQNASIAGVGWSPDGQWVHFLSQQVEAPSGEPPLTPGFFRVQTGEMCFYEELSGMFYAASHSPSYIVWEADSRVVIVADGDAYRGTPCGVFAAASADDIPDPWARSESPDGRFIEETEYDAESATGVTTIHEAATGTAINEVTWNYSMMGGDVVQWVGSDHLLVEADFERGPLLVEVGGRVIELLPELFGLDPQAGAYRAEGAVDAATGHYHLLLTNGVMYNDPVPLRLYHSESGEIEELPFDAHRGFSPDGGWAILTAPAGSDPPDTNTIWARPVEGEDGDTVLLAHANGMHWSAAGDLIAYQEVTARVNADGSIAAFDEAAGFVVMSFPGREVIGYWAAEGYLLHPVGWLPEGRTLLVSGFSTAAGAGDPAAMTLYLAEVGR